MNILLSLAAALLVACNPALADSPPPGTVKANLQTSGTALTSTSSGGKQALDVNVTNSSSSTTTVLQGTSPWISQISNFPSIQPASQSGAWSTGRTWSLLNSTDSVNVGNFPASFGRTWSLSSGSDSVAATQSGSWSISVGNFPASQQVTQGTSPWIVDGSAVVQPVSGPLTNAEMRASAVAITGALTDSQLRASSVPVSGTVTSNQGTSPWIVAGNVTATGSGNFTVVQPSGANLHTNVDNFPLSFGVSQVGVWTVEQGSPPWAISGSVTANIGTTNGLALNTTLAETHGSTAPGTAASKSDLAGGIYNSTPPTLANGEQAALQFDASGNLKTTASVTVPGTVGVTQSTVPWIVDGSLYIQPISAGSLPLPLGASTAANQATGNASAASIDGKIPSGLTVTSTRLQVDGSGVTQPISGSVTANIGTTGGLALDSSVAALQVAQGSTTSGENGSLVQAAASTAAPSRTDGKTYPFSLNLGGALRVDGSGSTQPVSGTVTANAGTGTFLVDGSAHTQPVSGSLGRTWLLSNLTDSVLVSGSVTSTGSGDFTVVQPTGSNLHANIDNFPATQAVTQSTSPWVVGGTVTANIGTSGSLALDATVSGLQVVQGSATSGQKAGLTLGAATNAAPSYSTGTSNPLSLTSSGALRVDGSASVQPVSGTFFQATQPVSLATVPLPTGAATSALQSTINSTLGSPFQAGGSIGNTTFASTQSGIWNITNVSGTVSLPTGASTSALQSTGNTALGTINATLGNPFQAGGSIANTSFGISGTLPAFASTPTVNLGTIGTAATAALQTTGNSSLSSLDTKTPALGQALAASSVPVVLTAAQLSTLTPLSTVAVTGTFFQATQPVSIASMPSTPVTGTFFQATQPVSIATAPVLVAGAAIIGKVGIDQTTPGTTNGVQVNAALPAGSNVIGHIISDSGSTTAVTGTVTANATLSAETTKVIGTVNVSASQTIGLSAGSAVIGHTINDSGSTTAVTGNVASTVADGANVVLGAKADAKSASTDTTAISIMSVLKQISASVQAPPSQAVTNAGTFAVQAAATEADGANVTIGAKADAKSTATDTTPITIMSVLKQISASVQAPPSQAVTQSGTWTVQPGNTPNTSPWLFSINDGTDTAEVTAASTAAAAANKALVVSQNPSGGNPCVNPTATLVSITGATSSTNATQIVALSGSTKIYICSMSIIGVSGTTPAFGLVSGTGSNCVTAQTTVIAAFLTTAGTLYNFAPPVAVTTAGHALCYKDTGTTPVQNYAITYVQQ